VPTRLSQLSRIQPYHLRDPLLLPHTGSRPASRTVYAAAPVVADPWLADASGSPKAIDWDATIADRQRIWGLGLGVAEAMDTAQRGMGLQWPAVQRLIGLSLEAAADASAEIVVGISTDQLAPNADHDLQAVTDAYLQQLAFVEERGGSAVMMPSRHLAAAARSAEDYVSTYDSVLSASQRPVILHWLGKAFDPLLGQYWGTPDLDIAESVVLDIIARNRSSIAGIKLSLLEAAREEQLRQRLPSGVRMFTGDDYNYVDLMVGDEAHHSDALLGAFAVVPRYAAAALARLDEGDTEGFRVILGPTQRLCRLVFEAPTQYYKVGVTWLAYLDGRQDHFRMIGGLESARSLRHLVSLFEAAADIGYFDQPDVALHRLQANLAVHGL
jgi:hypothetical protein